MTCGDGADLIGFGRGFQAWDRVRQRPVKSARFYLVSVVKLDGGVVRTAVERLYQQRDSRKSHHPRGAARPPSLRHIPSSAEVGSFHTIFRVCARN